MRILRISFTQTRALGVACAVVSFAASQLLTALAVAGPPTKPPLASSDVAILVPLKANIEVDSVFKSTGTGLCNAIQFNGVNGGILSQSQFEAFAKQVFGRGDDGRCNSDSSAQGGGDDATVLSRNPASHLARARGLPGRACNFAAWRVVGFRYEPCFERPGKTFKSRADLASCTPEARLVAQPWNTEGTPFPDDLAMHLIFRVPNPDALVSDLFSFAETTRTATKGNSWDEFDAKPDVLRPHPGLRGEMQRCDGPVSVAYRALLARHTNSTLLRQVAFMTSSTAQVQWTFGAMNFSGGSFSPLTDRAGDKFDNFSGDIFNFGSSFPFNASLKLATFPQTAKFFTNDLLMNPGDLSPAANKQAADLSADLNALEHPVRVGQGASNCISCHMVAQTRSELTNHGVMPSSAGTYTRVTLWPPFDDAVRSTFNFRNFGYGPSFEMGVSRRTANETDDVRQTINAIYR